MQMISIVCNTQQTWVVRVGEFTSVCPPLLCASCGHLRFLLLLQTLVSSLNPKCTFNSNSNTVTTLSIQAPYGNFLWRFASMLFTMLSFLSFLLSCVLYILYQCMFKTWSKETYSVTPSPRDPDAHPTPTPTTFRAAFILFCIALLFLFFPRQRANCTALLTIAVPGRDPERVVQAQGLLPVSRGVQDFRC